MAYLLISVGNIIVPYSEVVFACEILETNASTWKYCEVLPALTFADKFRIKLML